MIEIIDSFGNERIGFIVNEKLWKDYTYAGELLSTTAGCKDFLARITQLEKLNYGNAGIISDVVVLAYTWGEKDQHCTTLFPGDGVIKFGDVFKPVTAEEIKKDFIIKEV